MSPMTTSELTRRRFLAYGAAGVAGITLGQLGRSWLAPGASGAATTLRERWAMTVCRECAAACGMQVRLVDEVPVKLEGNPLCPVSRGRLCAKGQAALESYFDPDRLTGPARRTGPPDDPRWEPISWEAATALLAAAISAPAPGPLQALVVAAEDHGPPADAWATAWKAFGARVVWTAAPTAARLRPALQAITGLDRDPIFDFERATHVLSFGAPLAEDWLSGVWARRSYGRFRRSDGRPRGRLVQIEARRSDTARKADEWLAISADQQVALAYGIASVMFRENRLDRAALERWGGNLAQFEDAVVNAFPPDEVAAATGVPVITLLRLARDLASSTHPLAVVSADADPDLVNAVLSLNAIAGAYERAGGIFACPGHPDAYVDDALTALEATAAGTLQPKVIVFGDASALRALRAPTDLSAMVSKAELVVSFSPYLDETSEYANLLMPTHTPLEAWHGASVPAALAIEAVALAAPAVPPRLETRDRLALVKAVAAAIGETAVAACPWESSESVVQAEIGRLAALRRGTPYKGTFETDWVRELEEGGWWVPDSAAAPEFGRRVLDAGGWVDPFFEPGRIRDAVRVSGGLSLPLPRARAAGIAGAATERALPVTALRASEDDESPVRFPLRVVPFVPATLSLAGSPNQPALFELLGQPESAPWRVWAEIGPETASAIGVEQGAEVRITSGGGGEITAVALVVEGMASDSVAVAYVPTHARGGRWARLVDADVRRLWGGEGCRRPCHVRVVPA